MKKKLIHVCMLSIFIASPVFAQYESDTKTIESTINALYEVISGDAGVDRDWDRFKNLFIPEAQLIPTFNTEDGTVGYRVYSPEEYIEVADPILVGQGFWESELSNNVELFGNIAHVFSTYDSKRTKDGEVFARGINSIQLLNDGSRWHIVSVYWSSESEIHPIPSHYLKGEWISLFDGKSLDDWMASEHEGTFTIENGVIKVHGERSHLFYNGPVGNTNFKDFEFKAKVMTEENSNSGIFFHTKFQETGWPIHGYEAQVNNSYDVDSRRTASIYGFADNEEITFPDGEWMDYYIKVEGNRMMVKINGEVITDFTEEENVTRTRRLSSGTFALQGHDPESTVYYKDIFVREL